MGASTIYEVATRYVVEDRASRSLSSITAGAEKAGRGMSALQRVAGVIGIASVGWAAKKSFIDFNSTVEQSKLSLAALVNLNLGGTFDDATKKASLFFENLQEDAKKSTATTAELLDFASRIGDSLLSAGVGMEGLRRITANAVPAAQALGVDAAQSALDIEQALNGGVQIRDRFANKLLRIAKIDRESFNKLGISQRADILDKALSAPALMSARQRMEKTFAGAFSTLKDNFQITLGKIGLPLFRAVTAEINRWNSWLEKNPKLIAEFAEKFSTALAVGFDTVKSTVSFILDNKEAMFAIAAAFAGMKLVGGIGGIGGPLGALAGATGGLILGELAALKMDDKEREKKRNILDPVLKTSGQFVEANLDSTMNLPFRRGDLEAKSTGLLSFAQDIGALTTQGNDLALDKTKLRDSLIGLGAWKTEIENVLDSTQRALTFVNDNPMTFEDWKRQQGLFQEMVWAGEGGKMPQPEKQKIDISISKIEVASDDPDRFAFGLVATLRDMARSPSAANSLAGAF